MFDKEKIVCKLRAVMSHTFSSVFRKIDTFDPRVLSPEFPWINVLQLSPGSFQGWVLSAPMENCHITAGSFSQSVLCEGRYNPETFHVRFILSPESSVNVQAHDYDAGTLTIHRDAIALHEVFPSDMAWVDLAIPEKNISEKISSCVLERIKKKTRFF
jgi:hypothetical protein